MEPIVNGLESEFGERLTVYRLDASVAANVRLQQQFGLRGHPTFAVLDRNDKPVATFVGPQPVEALREAIVKAISP